MVCSILLTLVDQHRSKHNTVQELATNKFRYAMQMTLKSPSEKVGSINKTQNLLGLVANQTSSVSC